MQRYGKVVLNIEDRLTFAWWNTGLSPSGKDRATEGDFREAARITTSLLRDYHVDCLALGEVTRKDLERLLDEPKQADLDLDLYDGTGRQGRSVFDVGAIYRSDRLILTGSSELRHQHGKRSLKVAHKLIFLTDEGEPPLHLFVSHWPSHLQPNSEPLRTTLSHKLRDKVDRVIGEYTRNARVILMGDFNEEPFHPCMEASLRATRDRSLARDDARYLYNPFWRRLGESAPYTPGSIEPSFAGTCFLQRGDPTRWKTVDQIIVSSAFVGGSAWHLNEKLTMYLPVTPMALEGHSSAGIFDHFPVIAVIERNSTKRRQKK